MSTSKRTGPGPVSRGGRSLLQQALRLELALTGSGDGLWDWDLDNDQVYFSSTWSELLGWGQTDVFGSIDMLWNAVHAEDREEFKRVANDCVNGRLDHMKMRIGLLHRDGTCIAVLARAGRSQPGSELQHLVGTVVDMTEHEQIRQLLIASREQSESANRAKSTFLANMSHEIRTPMNAILGYAQLLVREQGLSDKQRGYVGTIVRSGDHLLQLINDVLAMSQIEAGRVKLSKRSFDWWTLLDDIEKMLGEKAESKQLQLAMDRQPAVPRFLVSDDGKIRQIVVNLVGNAIKFTSSGLVAVRVSCQPAADGTLRHELVVTDTGPGMTAEELERIFRPFEQGRAGTSKAVEGSGLGLAISAEYAQLLGGQLVASSQPGAGSTFTFRFPAPMAAHGVSSDPGAPHLGKGRVVKLAGEYAGSRALVADDLHTNREVLVRMLEELGFEVRDAADGREAIEVFRQFNPLVVLLDRKMPGFDGYATMRGIRGVVGGFRSKILFVTASAMQEDREEALELGADGFVAKPVSEGALVAELRRVLGVTFVEGDALEPVAGRKPPALSPIQRSSVPPNLASDMRRAAEAGDVDRLLALIPKLGDGQRLLQDSLKLSLERYDYDAVITWLDGEGGAGDST